MIDIHSFLLFASTSINQYGAMITFRKILSEDYDPTTGQIDSEYTDYPTNGIVEDYSEHFIAQGLAHQGDRKIIIAANSIPVAPNQGDRVNLGNAHYQVLNVECDQIADTPIVYTLHLRR